MKLACLTLLWTCALTAGAQVKPDPQIEQEVFRTRAIDNHSHVPRLVAPGEKDTEYDALPCDPLEPGPQPWKLRPENPEYLATWKALYGYPYNDASPQHVRELLQRKQQARREQGDHYPEWVLDQLGIETEFANRIAMGRGLNQPRFRWVPYDDALLFPFDTVGMQTTPDRRVFYPLEAEILKRYLKDSAIPQIPPTLSAYLERVVTPTLERQKQGGAVAVKFEAAYLRALDFEPATRDQASAVYEHALTGRAPLAPDYKILQDFLFRYIAAEAGRLKLAVHIHTGAGCGTYFQLAGADPMLLESVLDDPELRQTTFVIIHGGWPFTNKTAFLFTKPNVYADYSEQTWMLSARSMAQNLRMWLEWYPERVMFGTDLSPGQPEIDWEEIGWMTTHDARQALALALTGMVYDGEISRARALEFAHMVLHDNAAKLYGLAGGNPAKR